MNDRVGICVQLILTVQVRFDTTGMHRTMKGMDRAARLAMLPDHEIFWADLTERKEYIDVIRSKYT